MKKKIGHRSHANGTRHKLWKKTALIVKDTLVEHAIRMGLKIKDEKR